MILLISYHWLVYGPNFGYLCDFVELTTFCTLSDWNAMCFCYDGKLQWRMLLILVNEKLVTLFSFIGLLPEFHNCRPIFLLKILWLWEVGEAYNVTVKILKQIYQHCPKDCDYKLRRAGSNNIEKMDSIWWISNSLKGSVLLFVCLCGLQVCDKQ